MEKKDIGAFSILDVETVESADFASAWEISNIDIIETRKYGAKPFSDQRSRILDWIGTNRNRIRNLTFEQQEEMMIEEGIITRNDI